MFWTVVILKVVFQFVCLFTCLFLNSILTNNFNDDPYHSQNVCHLVSSLANISSIIVLCCILNRKLGTVNRMSVDRKLLAWSCPCYHRERVTKYVTLEHGVPCLVSGNGTLRFCNQFCWYYQKDITTQNVVEVQNARWKVVLLIMALGDRDSVQQYTD